MSLRFRPKDLLRPVTRVKKKIKKKTKTDSVGVCRLLNFFIGMILDKSGMLAAPVSFILQGYLFHKKPPPP